MYLSPNAAMTAGMSGRDLNDEQTSAAKTATLAAIKATGATGTAAKILFHEFYKRVYRADDGHAAAMVNGRALPLVDALACFFGVNPEVEAADKALEVYDEARSTMLRSYAERAQQTAKEAANAARYDAWKKLSAPARAVIKAGDNANAATLAACIDAENKSVSAPPANWTP